ncbi:MAG: EF-hand domain-containing protein [Pirellulales bacterium]
MNCMGRLGAVIGVSILLGTAGCPSRQATVEAPPVSPTSAAAKAIELYDADKDGALSKKELDKVPGILAAFDRYDLDKDKKVSQQEIADRLQKFVDNQLGLLSFVCQVNSSGRPLPGAQVRFVPEPFMEGMIKPAVGETGETGAAQMSLDPADPSPDLPLGLGLQWGIYKIQVTHPSAQIAEKYNTQTELGVEVSPIDMNSPLVVVDVKGR